MTARGYYAGCARVVVQGVPIRLARKPSRENLAWMREHVKEREQYGSARYWTKPGAERKKFDREQIDNAITAYANAMGISRRAAFMRAAKQKRAVEAAPVLNLSLEYDL